MGVSRTASRKEMFKGQQGTKNLKDADPEEGEIIDDYEFILSSDEELNMRQRIKELEATNEELEKISLISRSFGKYEYLPCKKLAITIPAHKSSMHIEDGRIKATRYERQLPSDVSSISSGDFSTPKKRKRSKSNVVRKMSDHQPKGHYLRHQYHRHHYGHRRKKRRHNYRHVSGRRVRCEQKLEAVSFESIEEGRYAHGNAYQINSSEDSDVTLGVSDEGDGDINREELRFALARSKSNKFVTSSLMERLRKDKICTIEKEESAQKANVELIKIDDDSDNSLEEQELRLIALKSAIIKKHLARKKRDAELAYSPTDFDDMLINSKDFDEHIDVVEEEELNGQQAAGMEISPVASPKLLNLEQEGEDLSNGVNSGTVNTKPVDMDIASSESDVEIIADDVGEQRRLKPINPLPPGSTGAGENIPIPSNISPEMPFHMYMQALQCEPVPPPPPDLYYDEQPPPAPSFCIQKLSANNMKDIELRRRKPTEDNERPQLSQPAVQSDKAIIGEAESECSSTEYLNSSNVENETKACHQEPCFKIQPKPSLVQNSEHWSNENNQESDEEEEKALRALLLAKIQSPLNSKHKITPKQKRVPLVASQKENERSEVSVVSGEIEQEANKKPAEAILKEAVRRLNNKCYPVNAQNCDLGEQNSIMNPSIGSGKLLERKNLRHGLIIPVMSAFGHDFKRNAEIQNDLKSSKRTIKEVVEENEMNNLDVKDENDSKKLEISVNTVGDSSNAADVSEKVDINVEESLRNKIKLNETKTAENIDKGKVGIVDVTVEDNITEVAQKNEIATKNVIIANGSVEQSGETVIANEQKNNSEDKLNSVIPLSKTNASLLIKPPELSNKNLKPSSVSVIKSSIAKQKSPVSILETSVSKMELLKRSIALKQTTNMLPAQKYVKHNKVINTNSQIKRKSISFPNELLKTKMTKINPTVATPPTKPNNTSSSRLITSLDMHPLQVKKLIITLRPSDSEEDVSNCEGETSGGTGEPRSKMLGPICASALACDNYYDNTSPMSLRMDSPVEHSVGASSPRPEAKDVPEVVTESAIASNAFEQKLDTFLRNIRTQEKQRTTVENSHATIGSEDLQQKNANRLMTPLAVRHLPKASQLEYRRLVHRMNMLQKQKQAKITHPSTELNNSNTDNTTNTTNTFSANLSYTFPSKTLPETANSKNTTGNGLPNQLRSKMCTSLASSSSESVPAKMNVLRTYESSYKKIGAGIISNLEKSFQLVEEAQKAKILKLRHEKRLKVLQAEMDEVRRKYKQDLQKMSKIYPAICDSNDIITTLKQKRFKLFQCATSLGRSIKGEDYRLNNELKQEISFKTAKLASAITFVNSLKYSDLDKLEAIPCDVKTLNVDHIEKKAEIVEEQTIVNNENVNQSEDDNNANITVIKDATTKFEQCDKSMSCPEKENSSNLQMLRNENQKDQREIRSCEPHLLEMTQQQQQQEITEMDSKVLSDYVSPLLCTKDCNIKSGNLDPNGIICPYELMGECEDDDCIYTHFDSEKKAGRSP